MMTERQRKFREQYKSDISPLYNGLVHIGVMYAVGIAAVIYCISQLTTASWEYLLIIPVFLAGNFVEWAMHTYVMHKRIDVFALRAIYERHTRQHHQYFTDNDITIDSSREFRIVFFHGGYCSRLASVVWSWAIWRQSLSIPMPAMSFS